MVPEVGPYASLHAVQYAAPYVVPDAVRRAGPQAVSDAVRKVVFDVAFFAGWH